MAKRALVAKVNLAPWIPSARLYFALTQATETNAVLIPAKVVAARASVAKCALLLREVALDASLKTLSTDSADWVSHAVMHQNAPMANVFKRLAKATVAELAKVMRIAVERTSIVESTLYNALQEAAVVSAPVASSTATAKVVCSVQLRVTCAGARSFAKLTVLRDSFVRLWEAETVSVRQR